MTQRAGFGSEPSILEITDAQAQLDAKLDKTGGTITGALTVQGNFTVNPGDSVVENLEINGDLNHDGSNVGFFNVTPTIQAAAYTQTYATASRTQNNLTSATLTDNSGGIPDTTIQALTDPANAPVDADALRDDLVLNLIPELRNNFADLADQVNKLRVDLENVKQVVNSLIDDSQSFGLAG